MKCHKGGTDLELTVQPTNTKSRKTGEIKLEIPRPLSILKIISSSSLWLPLAVMLKFTLMPKHVVGTLNSKCIVKLLLPKKWQSSL
jgi:hypothetical protein